MRLFRRQPEPDPDERLRAKIAAIEAEISTSADFISLNTKVVEEGSKRIDQVLQENSGPQRDAIEERLERWDRDYEKSKRKEFGLDALEECLQSVPPDRRDRAMAVLENGAAQWASLFERLGVDGFAASDLDTELEHLIEVILVRLNELSMEGEVGSERPNGEELR